MAREVAEAFPDAPDWAVLGEVADVITELAEGGLLVMLTPEEDRA